MFGQVYTTLMPITFYLQLQDSFPFQYQVKIISENKNTSAVSNFNQTRTIYFRNSKRKPENQLVFKNF